MKKNILLIHLFIILAFFAEFAGSENLLDDSSFEDIRDISKDKGLWRILAFNQDPGTSEFRVETGDAHTGKKYVTIINHKENHTRFVQRIGVQGGEIYRLSCWARTENVETKTKGANITEEGILEHSPSVSGTTKDWVYTEMYIRIGIDIDTIAVAVSLGGYYGTNTGKASFDDVTVEEVNEIPRGAVIATKGDFIEKKRGKKKEEQPVRIVKEPGPVSVPVFIALILALASAAFITGRIVYINLVKKKLLKKKESEKEESEQ
ncbi:MAG: hypothetical protein JXB88_27305 [Spirochaetales bacterium]|nr:hypothetical protein [Spirochaetales bacterium]